MADLETNRDPPWLSLYLLEKYGRPAIPMAFVLGMAYSPVGDLISIPLEMARDHQWFQMWVYLGLLAFLFLGSSGLTGIFGRMVLTIRGTLTDNTDLRRQLRERLPGGVIEDTRDKEEER